MLFAIILAHRLRSHRTFKPFNGGPALYSTSNYNHKLSAINYQHKPCILANLCW